MIAEIVAITVLALWWLASAVAQPDWLVGSWVRARDPFGLIPSFSFFAPNPASTDCHLLHRHVLAGGEVTPWRESFVWRPVWYRGLWNPDRREEKAISDASSGLVRRRNDRPASVRLSVPYLLLLNHVSAQPAPPGAVGVQFVLMGSSDDGSPPFVRMLSEMHALDHNVPLPAGPPQPEAPDVAG